MNAATAAVQLIPPPLGGPGVVGRWRGALAREPIEHELKTWPDEFEATLQGWKPYEHRAADRDYRVGDTLLLREWEPTDKLLAPRDGVYTGRALRRTITYVTPAGDWGLPPGVCCLGIPTPATEDLRVQLALQAADHILQSDIDDLEAAWGIIANVSGGDWSLETPSWQAAAAAWRDRVLPAIAARTSQRAAAAGAAAQEAASHGD